MKGTTISLDTTSPEISTTLEPELVDAAPIEISGLARQIDSFSYLAPGVQGSATSHAINGGVRYENEVQFNGVPVAFVQFQGNQTNINPPYESVNEFRVNTATFNAQYGLGQGAVTFSLASGTTIFTETHSKFCATSSSTQLDSSRLGFLRPESPKPRSISRTIMGSQLGARSGFPICTTGRTERFSM